MVEALRELFEESTEDLSNVTIKRMFGCDAFFADENIFGLIWKTGRIGLKLTDDEPLCELTKMPGSEPWTAGNRTMAHWVLVPPQFHDDRKSLVKWVKKAHALALAKPKGKAKTKPKASAKKPVAKRRVGRA